MVCAIAYSGHGDSIWNPIPPSSWAYTYIAGYSYNLQKAKALLAQAGESHLSLTVTSFLRGTRKERKRPRSGSKASNRSA